jgi:hypothetical protein
MWNTSQWDHAVSRVARGSGGYTGSAVSDRETLEGLTQFGVSPVESQLQVIDSKDGEMSEWLKAHAWKLIPAARADAH